MSKIIRWEDLPEKSCRRKPRETKHEVYAICEEVIQQQMLYKNKWAVIKICESAKEANSFAWLLNNDRIKIPDGDFQFASRDIAVYAKYVKR